MIQMRDVRAGYRGAEVLHGVDLTLEPGRVYGIVGPNGCGKSTLLRTMAGLCPVQSGSVLVDGLPLAGLTPAQAARRVAYLPQGRSVPAITAGRLVLHGRFPYLSSPRRYRREDLEIARRALRWAGAEAFAHKELGELSGGERQRVYIAMTLAQETGTVLQKAAEADMRWEAYQNAVRAACDACEFQVDYDAVRIASPAGVYGDASAAENLAAG